MGFFERFDDIPRPSAMLVYAIVMVSYFMVTAGIAFDVIQEPPAMGAVNDPITGKLKPQPFLPYRINGQYIIEGLCGGFLYTVGGLAIVALDRSRNKKMDLMNRKLLLAFGVCGGLIAFGGCMTFIRIKMPNYLHE